MKINDLTPEKKIELIENHLAVTRDALVEVFGLERTQAADYIDRFQDRYKDSSLEERVFVLHRDPVALAADMTEMDLDDPNIADRLERFNKQREQVLEMALQFT